MLGWLYVIGIPIYVLGLGYFNPFEGADVPDEGFMYVFSTLFWPIAVSIFFLVWVFKQGMKLRARQ